MTLVVDDYRFIYVDIGDKRRFPDGAIFRNSSLHKALENKVLNITKNDIIVTVDAF